MKYPTLLLASLALAACSKNDPDRIAAQDFYQKATEALQQGDGLLAIEMLDSIDQHYPGQVEIRRQAMPLRPQAIEMVTLSQISATDALLAQAQMDISELEPQMKHIPGGDLDGYYVVSEAYNPAFINTTGIEGRINDDNLLFYMVAQNKGKRIGIRAIQLSSAEGQYQSESIPEGSARVDVVEGGEIASFLSEEVDALGEWASQNSVTGASIVGDNGSVTVKLSPKQAAAIGKAWKYANARVRERQARIVREKLERQLQIARDQKANLNETPAN